MLENMTTEEKVIAGLTAVGIAALVFHKPTRNAVGLSDRRKREKYNKDYFVMTEVDKYGLNKHKHHKVSFPKEVKVFVTFESGKKYQREFGKDNITYAKKVFTPGNIFEFKNGKQEIVKSMTLKEL